MSGMMNVLMIDNYDSFTYNLVQYLGELGAQVNTIRNDAIDVAGIRELNPDAVVLSPGPCTPNEAGVCLDVVAELGGELPILGVCLGHQAIGQALGGKVVRARNVMHGKTSMMHTTTKASSTASTIRSKPRVTIRWSWIGTACPAV